MQRDAVQRNAGFKEWVGEQVVDLNTAGTDVGKRHWNAGTGPGSKGRGDELK